MSSKYIHREFVHNTKSPDEIVPELIKLFNPKSVADIGCGIGTFLHLFKKHGVEEVIGIDGSWTNRELLHKYIEPQEFIEADLEQPIRLEKKYDLVLSLEVAEHLAPSVAETFVQSLVNSGNIIVFSAAAPLQGGQNHLNEQWLSYWKEKFARHGLKCFDILRPLFWDNPKIDWWYKQNMVLFSAQDLSFEPAGNWVNPMNVIHNDNYFEKAELLNDILEGRKSKMFYLRLLSKSVFGGSFTNQVEKILKG